MSRPTRQTAAGAAYNDLRNLARRQGRSTSELFQLYLLERFLYRLAAGPHRDRLVLKGGALLAAYELRRQTRDIDVQAIGVANTEDEVARLVVDVAQTSLDEDDGIEFQVEEASSSTIRDGDRYSGVRIRLPATLAKARLAFSVDVSFGDPVTPPPEKIMYPSLRGEPFSVIGYPLTTVVSEKVISMLELGDANTRERDFGDVYRIMTLHPVDARELAEAFEATAAYRETEVRPLSRALTDLPARRQASWERWRDRAGMEDELPPSLESVVDAVSAFVDPILSGSIVEGTWDPAHREWGGGESAAPGGRR